MGETQNSFFKLNKFGYFIIVTALLYWAFSKHVYDDPFITYRYAENLRNGFGFVYNPDEQILSTTTPLFAMLLALLSGFVPNHLPQLANFIGAASLAIGGGLLWELGQIWKTPFVAWSGLLLYPTFPLLVATIGSETPLFLALIIGAFVLYARQHIGGTVILIALAILTRSDGLLIAGILGIHYLWRHRTELREVSFWTRQPWLWIGIAAGVLLAWHAFAWFYFGAPLPITLAAKQAQGRMNISQHFAPGLIRIVSWYANRWHYLIEFVLVVFGLGFSVFRKKKWLLFLGWTGLYFVAYSLLGVTRYFWYYAPLVPGWIVALGLGLAYFDVLSLQDRFYSIFGKEGWWRVSLILLLVIILGAQILHLNQMRQIVDQRYAIYRAVGEWLNENTPIDSSVGALEVGMIGYFSKRPMVDFAGLIQPDVATQMAAKSTYDDTAVWATQTYQPQYLVLIKGAHPRLEQEIVNRNCQPMQSFPGSQYDFNADMQIFACQYD